MHPSMSAHAVHQAEFIICHTTQDERVAITVNTTKLPHRQIIHPGKRHLSTPSAHPQLLTHINPLLA